MSEKAERCSGCHLDESPRERTVQRPDKRALLNRVRRIEGQISGVRQMIEADRYCVDVLTQISAAKAALDAVSLKLLSAHAEGCVRRAVLEDGGDEAIGELMSVVAKLVR